MPDKAAGIEPLPGRRPRPGRDDQPERMSGKPEAPERRQGRQHQGVQEVIEAEVDNGGVGQSGQLF